MFSAIWAEVGCEANCAQFGRRLVLRSCVRKVYKFALVYCERTGDGDQISGRFCTSERGDEASNGIPNGRSDGPRSPSERIYIIFTVSPLIFTFFTSHYLIWICEQIVCCACGKISNENGAILCNFGAIWGWSECKKARQFGRTPCTFFIRGKVLVRVTN